MDPLKDKALGRPLEVQDPFHPENVLPFGLKEVAQPGVEPFGVQLTCFLDTDAGDGFVVLMIVDMAPVFVDVLGLNHHPRFFPFPGELIESVLGKQRVPTMGSNLDPESRSVLAQHQLVDMLAWYEKPARARGHRDLLE